MADHSLPVQYIQPQAQYPSYQPGAAMFTDPNSGIQYQQPVGQPGPPPVYGGQVQYVQQPGAQVGQAPIAYTQMTYQTQAVSANQSSGEVEEGAFKWWMPIIVSIIVFIVLLIIGYGYVGCVAAALISIISGIAIKIMYPGSKNAKLASLTIAVGIVFIFLLILMIIMIIISMIISSVSGIIVGIIYIILMILKL